MEKLILRLLHFIIYSVLFIYKFVMLKVEYIGRTIKQKAYQVYYMYDEKALIEAMCSKDRMKGSKKLEIASIVINN